MSKSPEPERKHRLDAPISAEAMARELSLEARIQSRECRIADRELAADRELKTHLASLQPPSLPPALRQRVLAHAADQQRIPMRWMALAAAVVMSLLAVVAMQTANDTGTTDIHQLTADDWAQLDLALDTLGASGRRVAQVTDREVRSHLAQPDIRITVVPGSDTVWNWFPPFLQQTR